MSVETPPSGDTDERVDEVPTAELVEAGDVEETRAQTDDTDQSDADPAIESDEEKVEGDKRSTRRRKPRQRAVPMGLEVRHWNTADRLEVRSAQDGSDEIHIAGVPIVYNSPYVVTDMFGEFEERMSPGVARNVLQSDVRFLFNHDGMPFARTTSGTLQLQDGDSELRFVARLDARQQSANDLAIAIERGDISQMSVGFIPAQDEWNDDMDERSVTLFAEMPDISAVTYPCSPTTHIQVAERMVSEVPIESRARLRKIYTELRAGKVLSQGNQDKLIAAASALHEVLDRAGFDPEPAEEAEPVQDRADEPEVETVEAAEPVAEERSEFADAADEIVEDDGSELRRRRLKLQLQRDLLKLRKAA